MIDSKIVASLTYGKVLSGKWMAFLYVLCFLEFLFLVGIILMGIYDNVSYFFGLLFCTLVIVPSLWLIKRFRGIRRKVSLWVQDAVELPATSVYVATQKLAVISFGANHMIKVSIRFKFDGKTKRQMSIFDSVFRKYCDREIKILYSPTYDQVLILKDR